MKTAQQALAKWEASTALGTETWATNLQNTSKPIVSAALAQRNVAVQNFSLALAPGGSWERNLSAVGDAGIKSAAVAKKQNYASGVQQGAQKMGVALGKIIAYEQNGLAAIYSMPKGTTAAGIARASAWISYMAAGKGQLGAS